MKTASKYVKQIKSNKLFALRTFKVPYAVYILVPIKDMRFGVTL